MKTFIRVLSLVLALLMLASAFVSCDKPDDKNDEDTKNNDAVASTDAQTEEETKTKLPEMNWEGESYRILGREFTEDNFRNFEVDRDEMPEDVVGLAVWNRNEAIKAKYGLDVVGTLEEKPADSAKVFLSSGDDLYDLILCPISSFQAIAMEGYLVNISTLKYIDLEHPCWNGYANEQLTFGGKLYYTTNKFMLQDKHRTWSIWYNRTLARELNIGYLETEVFDGTWTIDRLIEVAKIGAIESNGESGMTSGDTWGVVLSSSGNLTQLLYGSGFRISTMGNDGYPVLVGADETSLSIIDKVLSLTSDPNTCFVNDVRPTTDTWAEGIYNEGRAVIMTHCLSYSSNISRLTFEYGVLPNPKYTAEQDNYYCLPDTSNGSLMAVPSTINNIDKAGFGLEALSEESVETSYKDYIETKCKLQVAFDEDMSKCLNIIFDNVAYDIAYLNDYGGLRKVVQSDMIKESQNIYSRMYDKYKKKATNQINKIKETYASLPS